MVDSAAHCVVSFFSQEPATGDFNMDFMLNRTVAGNPYCSAEAALLVYTMVGSREDVPAQVSIVHYAKSCFVELLFVFLCNQRYGAYFNRFAIVCWISAFNLSVWQTTLVRFPLPATAFNVCIH